MEYSCAKGLELNLSGVQGGLRGCWCGEVVHDEERWVEVFFSSASGVFLCFGHVFAEGVFVDAEVEGWTSWCECYS